MTNQPKKPNEEGCSPGNSRCSVVKRVGGVSTDGLMWNVLTPEGLWGKNKKKTVVLKSIFWETG